MRSQKQIALSVMMALLAALIWGVAGYGSQNGHLSLAAPAEANPKVLYAEGLPVPGDAQGVAYNADFKQIKFTSPSGIESLVAFYRQDLTAQGWQENRPSAVVAKSGAVLRFKQGEATASVNISNSDQTSRVAINTSCVMWPGPEAKVLYAEGLPVPGDAQGVAYNADFKQIKFADQSDIESLVTFYRRGLAAQGWQENRPSAVVAKSGAVLRFKQRESTLSVNMSKVGVDKATNVTLITNCVQWAGVTP